MVANTVGWLSFAHSTGKSAERLHRRQAFICLAALLSETSPNEMNRVVGLRSSRQSYSNGLRSESPCTVQPRKTILIFSYPISTLCTRLRITFSL